MVAQFSKDPALSDLNAGLSLRLIPGFSRTGRNNHRPIMFRHLLVTSIQFGLVTAGFDHGGFRIIRRGDPRRTPKEGFVAPLRRDDKQMENLTRNES